MTTLYRRAQRRNALPDAAALDAEDFARNMEVNPDAEEPHAMGGVVLLLIAVVAVLACAAAVHVAGAMGWLP